MLSVSLIYLVLAGPSVSGGPIGNFVPQSSTLTVTSANGLTNVVNPVCDR